ncbi:MAG: hypothetical protein K2X99_01690 [Gemmatimonadaceae bacterium]|nr:hypothetical protein [Gemmatimonadaceae bacterium]
MHPRTPLVLSCAAFIAAACSSSGPRHEREALTWSAPLAAGTTLRLRNLNGPITVFPIDSGPAVVTAVVRWRGSDALPVHFDSAKTPESTTLCAMWGRGECSASQYSNKINPVSKLLRRSGNVEVRFVAKVPRGVKVDVQTVNGRIEATATAPVRAVTVNGEIMIATAVGPVTASTVNGSIDARMTKLAEGDVTAKTVNGSVTLSLPATLTGQLSGSVTNGRISSEFPGTVGRRDFNTSLGTSVRRIRAETVNGSIDLRQLNAQGVHVSPAVGPAPARP